MQKYEEDTQTTCQRHITSGFCPKMEKISGGAKIAKKIRGCYAKQDIFLSLGTVYLCTLFFIFLIHFAYLH